MAANTAPVEPPTAANWLSILFLGLIWGGTFMLTKIALGGIEPITLAASRILLAAIALMPFALPRMRGIGREHLPYLIWAGLLSTAVPFSMLSWGLQHVPSAFGGLSMAMLPLVLLPMAHFFVPGERLTPRRIIGVALGFAGAALLIAGGGDDPGASGPLGLAGRIVCLAATICYSVASILTRRCPPIDGIAMAALTLVFGAIAIVPFALFVEGAPALPPTRPLLAAIALGLVPTALAVLLRIQVVRSAGPGFMTLVNFQVPVWSVIFGVVLLGETLPPTLFAALALIGTGLVIGQWRTVRTLLHWRG
ncbi:DMT family transporter [Roseicyclus sp. F158]|uniref:DMT family transporter n=1 Tax=Tropicimonas omnivorans TaxID=3075590 RepID=A0ABU3DFY4_9RHOB|nr:DMT family transporter [Roseicyclus sp. F158]MDT0682621.1 DMT family transporter [Roseicyclus sp. F158]